MRRIETIIREYKAPEKEKKSLANTIKDMGKSKSAPKGTDDPDKEEKSEPTSPSHKDKIKLSGEKEPIEPARLHLEVHEPSYDKRASTDDWHTVHMDYTPKGKTKKRTTKGFRLLAPSKEQARIIMMRQLRRSGHNVHRAAEELDEAAAKKKTETKKKPHPAPDIVSAHRSMPHNSIMHYQNSSIYTHDLPPMGKNLHGTHLKNAKGLAKRLGLQVHSTPRPHGYGTAIKTSRITVKGNHRNVELYHQGISQIYAGGQKPKSNK